MIIGIHGRARAGKDTVGEILTKVDGQAPVTWLNFQRKAFGDKIKIITSELLAVDPAFVFTDGFKQTKIPHLGITGREFLQQIGTDILRNQFSEDVWIDALMNDYKPGMNWVITDVRFKNEATRIKELGGLLLKVERDVPQGDHISEKDLNDWEHWDLVIDNNGTLTELSDNVLKETSKLLNLHE